VVGDSNEFSGVVGLSSADSGVFGQTSALEEAGVAGFESTNSNSGSQGVLGLSENNTGVSGRSVAVSGLLGFQVAGVVGESNTNIGVIGLSSSTDGVYGETTGDRARGVLGQDNSPGGGYGVYGASAGGTGVVGTTGSSGGFGVEAVNTSSTGAALSVSGIAKFSRSGLVSIVAGKSSATVTGVSILAASLVLANLQNSLPGVYVEAVVPNVPGSSFKIVLSEAVPAGMKANVGWFVVN
jgi:hypothetical protein